MGSELEYQVRSLGCLGAVAALFPHQAARKVEALLAGTASKKVVRVVGRDVKEGSRGGECQQRVVSHSTFWLGKVEVRFSYWLKSKRRSFDDDETVIRGSVLLGRRLALSFAWRVGEGSGRRLAELVVHVSPLRRAAKCWAKSWRSCSGKQEKKDDDGKDDDGKDDDGKDEEEEEEEEEEERLALMMLASWCCVEEQALHLSLGDVCAEPAFAALFARRRRESRLLYKTRQRGQLSAAPNENRR